MAVGRVFAQAHIGDHDDLKIRPPDGFDHLLDRCIHSPGSRPALVFAFGNAEENDAADALLLDGPAFFEGPIDRLLVDTGKRRNFFPDPCAGTDEHGIHQTGGCEHRFTYQRSDGLRPPQPPWPMLWIAHCCSPGSVRLEKKCTICSQRSRTEGFSASTATGNPA